MPDSQSITQEGFRTLLGWLDADVERAGEKYENIRRRLIWFFVRRGCHEAELLADRTIDRVITRVAEIRDVYEGEPIRYFFGVARHIHQEWVRGTDRERDLPIIDLTVDPKPEEDHRFECLLACLTQLSKESQDLILEYHRDRGREKIQHRKEIAVRLGISLNALQAKVCRIRSRLEEWVDECVRKKMS